MWRPEHWENPCYEIAKKMADTKEMLGVNYMQQNGASYEAGADAMFDALRREGNSKGGRVENDPIRGTGTWLFMPDENKELLDETENREK